jgi:phage host-nuclease inhibitor protein Gam
MAKKVAPEPAIKTWEAADLALREIGEIEILVDKKEGAANLRINEIKEKLAEELNGKLGRKARLEKDLEEFFEARVGEVAPAKSRKLNFGTLGFRTCPSKLKLASKWTWEKVVKAIIDNSLVDYLRAPPPEADKEKIKAELDGETMKQIGVRVASDEEFYLTIDRQKIQETA